MQYQWLSPKKHQAFFRFHPAAFASGKDDDSDIFFSSHLFLFLSYNQEPIIV